MCSCAVQSVDAGPGSPQEKPVPRVRRFSPEPASCRQVRRFVRAVLAEAGLDAEVSELLASELATNVIRHGQTRFTVRVWTSTVVRVEVQDGNALNAIVRAAGRDDEGGRGLALVDALADRWGVEDRDGGKVVWFEHLA